MKTPLLRTPLTREYLLDRFVDKHWSYHQIYKETGWGRSSIARAIGDNGLNRRRDLRGIDLIGKTFGELTVVAISQKQKRANYWLCDCACGTKNVQVATGNLLSGNTTSCGCRNHRVGVNSPTWKGKTALSVRYWHIIQSNAAKRGIYIDITIDDAWDVYVNQKGKCALTGWGIKLSSSLSQTASLDRIDSSQGYVKGNIQWLHKDVNRAKNVMSQKDFVEMCKSVATNV
jgi:hypothetical protein